MVLLGKYTLPIKDPCATEKEAVGVQAFLTYSFDDSSGGGSIKRRNHFIGKERGL